MKIASWNVNSLRTRLQQVIAWVNEHQPDILGLQELKLSDPEFPLQVFQELGYHCIWFGQKAYNGVALLSRNVELSQVCKGIPGFDDPQSRVIAGCYDQLRVINAYVPNGASLDSEKFTYKLQWLEHFNRYLQNQLAEYSYVAVMGDFNIAPEDQDVHDPKAWEGSVLVSPAERAAFQQLLGLGLQDSFRLFTQPEKSYSWWDYRQLAFRRNRGLRIDHILVNTKLAACTKSSYIDKAPRKLEQPSDHAPVVAELILG